MKAITPDNFKIVLHAAVILTDAQDYKDEKSIGIAFDLWQYIDFCRYKLPYLKDVNL